MRTRGDVSDAGCDVGRIDTPVSSGGFRSPTSFKVGAETTEAELTIPERGPWDESVSVTCVKCTVSGVGVSTLLFPVRAEVCKGCDLSRLEDAARVLYI